MADNLDLIKISKLIPTTELKSGDMIPISQDGETRSIKGAVLEQKLLNKTDARYIENSQKGATNGVATLDAEGKLKESQRWKVEINSQIQPIDLSTEVPKENGVFQPIEVGVYPNFGNLEFTEEEKNGSLVFFYYLDGVFSKQVKQSTTINEVEPNNTNAVSSDGVYKYGIRDVGTIEELRTVNGKEEQIIRLLGYYEAGDKPELLYKWVSGIGVDDGGSVIVVGEGYWEALFGDSVDIRDFGAKINGDITNILSKIVSIRKNIHVPSGTYNCGYVNLAENNGITIKGIGYESSIIKMTEKVSIDLSNNSKHISNIAVYGICFDGDNICDQINIYRLLDSSFINCKFVNFIGKTLTIDRSYQITLERNFFKTENTETKCLIELTSNAVNISNKNYFNTRRYCPAIMVGKMSVNNDNSKNIVNGNVFESCLNAITSSTPDAIIQSLDFSNNYIEGVEDITIPILFIGNRLNSCVFSNNLIGQSTKYSMYFEDIDYRSTISIFNNRLHRQIKIIDNISLESKSIYNRIAQFHIYDNSLPLFTSENYTYMSQIVYNNSLYINDLHVTRGNVIGSDIELPTIKFSGHIVLESNNTTKLFGFYSPTSSLTNPRGFEINIKLLSKPKKNTETPSISKIEIVNSNTVCIAGSSYIFNSKKDYLTNVANEGNKTDIVINSGQNNLIVNVKGYSEYTQTISKFDVIISDIR